MSSPPIIYCIIQDFQDNRKHDLHSDCMQVANNILSFAQSNGGTQSYIEQYITLGDEIHLAQCRLPPHGTHSPTTMDGGMGIHSVLPIVPVTRPGQAACGDRSTYCHPRIRTPQSSSSSYSPVFFLRMVRVFTELLWLGRQLALQVERKLFILTLSI